MQKKIVSLILFVVLLGLVGYFIYSTIDLKADKQALEPVAVSALKEDAKIVKEEGEVTIERKNANIMVSNEEKLEVNDVVTLQGETSAVFYWPDGSVSRASGPAEIVVEAMMFDNTTGDTNTEMQIRSGEVWTKVMGMVTEGSTVTVRAGDTVAGIRGTEVIHNVTGTGVTIGVLEHGVEVTRRGSTTPVLRDQELVARNAASQVDMRPIPLAALAREESWNKLVSTHTTSLNAKRTALLGTPTRSLEDIIKDTDTLLSRTDRTENENIRIHKNIQEMVAGLHQAAQNDDQDGLAKHVAALEKSVGQARNAFASNTPHLNKLLTELTMFNKIVITDKPMSSELLPFRQLMQKEKSLIYQSTGRTEELERMVLRELFFVQDLSATSLEDADMVMKSIEGSEALLKPLQDIENSENAAMIRGVLDTLEKEKVTTSDRVQSLRGKLFPEGSRESLNSNVNVNTNTNAGVLLPRLPEEDLKTPTQKVTPTSTATKTNANAVKPQPTTTKTNTTPTPEKTTTTTTTPPATTTVEPKPALTAPNRTVEPAPVKVEPTTTTTTRGTITAPR